MKGGMLNHYLARTLSHSNVVFSAGGHVVSEKWKEELASLNGNPADQEDATAPYRGHSLIAAVILRHVRVDTISD